MFETIAHDQPLVKHPDKQEMNKLRECPLGGGAGNSATFGAIQAT
jgi:hypothetical protein